MTPRRLFHTLLLALLMSRFGLLAQPTLNAYVLRHTVPASLSDGGRTGLMLNRNDVVLLRVTGRATYGPLAAWRLGEVEAGGSTDPDYRRRWNREAYSRERFGALIARVGQAPFFYPIRPDFRDCMTGPFSIGTCPATPTPVAGVLFVAEADGELRFDINDQWVPDNRGEFTVDVVVLTKGIVTRQQGVGGWLMCQALTDNRNTVLLDSQNLVEYHRFYHKLDSLAVVRQAGIRWQKVAIEVTGLLITANVILDELRQPSSILQVSATKLAFLLLYQLCTTKYGKEFLTGVASDNLIKDVYHRFYEPLRKGTLRVKDAFWFDVAAVYAEQANQKLQNEFYQNFGTFDKWLVEGAVSRFYSKQPGCFVASPEAFQGDVNIGLPLDRVKIGLYKMGYSWQQINAALRQIKTLGTQQGKDYEGTIEALLKLAQ